MFSSEATLLGLALAMDAAAVSFSLGILCPQLSFGEKLSRGLGISLLFAFFQALMIGLGSYVGFYFSFSSIGHMFELSVACIFILLGLRVVQNTFTQKEMKIVWGFLPLLFLAFATSIDALGAGLSFGPLANSYQAAIYIGMITFICCGIFYGASLMFKSLPLQWTLRFAGVILIFLGAKIIVH